VVQVAEAFYHDVPELVLLVIDGDALTADLRWEAPAHPATIEPGVINEDQKFPHIYGPLNLDAVLTLVPWARNLDGTFTLPAELRPE
jgi:glutathione S-transferase